MNFSDEFRQNHYLSRYSPNGFFIANCVQYRLVVRDVKTLQIVHLFTNLDAVDYMEWSPDSDFILCGMFKRGVTQVWSMENPDWRCKIDEGMAGLVTVKWSPDSRHILTIAEFNIRITLWSLIDKSVSYFEYPKHANKGLDFTKDGHYMALAERRNCKDFLSIFACKAWKMVKHFEVQTQDLSDIAWSPDGRALCVWDHIVYNKVCLYSMDGRCLSTYERPCFGLGVKTVTWSPTSQFLAIGGYDEKCRVFNHLTWKTIVEHKHSHVIDKNEVIVYKEVENKPTYFKKENISSFGSYIVTSKYEVKETPVQIPLLKPDPEKPNPKVGVGHVSFSSKCQFMATRNDNMPYTLWIWNVITLKLYAVLIQTSPIKTIQWDPQNERVALCTGNNKLYFWSVAGCVTVDVPTESEALFQVNSLSWHPDGDNMLLLSKDRMVVCFLSPPER
ncbi:WD repeat-containing protein WRAP73-like [Xenia sp. Carnegie-2017]|uniref:WD repeat-containing protein WRAP73-like n=1 Tax=Xenia sp. Carnegie-2017 TaxID=2897299 RepID=UPI001F0489BB|nr:WD repeat-containing protein WRAP73-like [Xenia sp. Carnegie-2017]